MAKVKIYTSPAEEVGTLHASVPPSRYSPLACQDAEEEAEVPAGVGQGPVMSMNWDFCVQCPTTKSFPLVQGPELVAS